MKKQCKTMMDLPALKMNDCLMERFLTDSCGSCHANDDDTRTTYAPDSSKLKSCSQSHHHVCLRKSCINIAECDCQCSHRVKVCGTKIIECKMSERPVKECVDDVGRPCCDIAKTENYECCHVPICRKPRLTNLVERCKSTDRSCTRTCQEIHKLPKEVFEECRRSTTELTKQLKSCAKVSNVNLQHELSKKFVKECDKDLCYDPDKEVVRCCRRDCEVCRQTVKECDKEPCRQLVKECSKDLCRQLVKVCPEDLCRQLVRECPEDLCRQLVKECANDSCRLLVGECVKDSCRQLVEECAMDSCRHIVKECVEDSCRLLLGECVKDSCKHLLGECAKESCKHVIKECCKDSCRQLVGKCVEDSCRQHVGKCVEDSCRQHVGKCVEDSCRQLVKECPKASCKQLVECPKDSYRHIIKECCKDPCRQLVGKCPEDSCRQLIGECPKDSCRQIVKECCKESCKQLVGECPKDSCRQIVKECCKESCKQLTGECAKDSCRHVIKECCKDSCRQFAGKCVEDSCKKNVRECPKDSCKQLVAECARDSCRRLVEECAKDSCRQMVKKCEKDSCSANLRDCGKETIAECDTSLCTIDKATAKDCELDSKIDEECKRGSQIQLVRDRGKSSISELGKQFLKESGKESRVALCKEIVRECGRNSLVELTKIIVKECGKNSCMNLDKQIIKECKSSSTCNMPDDCQVNTEQTGGILAVGGITNLTPNAEDRGGTQMWLYLIQDKIWRDLPPLPQPRHSHGACMRDRCIYVTGGIDPSPNSDDHEATCTMFIFDPRLGSWGEGLSLTSARSHHKMVVFNNIVWVIGGKDNQGLYLDMVEYLNIHIQQWIKVCSMPSPRGGLSVGVYQKQIFVAGGRSNALDEIKPVEPVGTLSFDGNKWMQQSDLESGLFCAGLVNVNETLYLIGGARRHLCSNDKYTTACFSSITEFSSWSKEWKRIQNLCIPRYNMGCVSSDGKIFVLGGITVDPLREEMILLKSVECYDSHSRCMMKMFQMPCAVAGLECILIPDVKLWCQNE